MRRVMDFRIDYTVTGDEIVNIALSGSLDVATAPELRDLLVALIDEGHYRLVLEMSVIDFIDSVGVGVFVGIVHRLRPHDGVVTIAGPSAQTRKVFEITQLTRVLPLYASADEAMTAIRRGTVNPSPS